MPFVPLAWLHELGGSIIIRDVKPETMRNGSPDTLTETERVAANKVCPFPVRIIKGIEEIGSGWTQKVLYVLLQCINIFPRWIFGNLLVV